MTKEEALEIYEQMKEYYGDHLANFIHYPGIFAHQYKVFKYFKDNT